MRKKEMSFEEIVESIINGIKYRDFEDSNHKKENIRISIDFLLRYCKQSKEFIPIFDYPMNKETTIKVLEEIKKRGYKYL